MEENNQPQTWGYGLTWFTAIGLTVLIFFGVFKLAVTAKESTKYLEEQMKIAEESRIEEIKADNIVVDKLAQAEEAETKTAAVAAATSAGTGDVAKGKILYNNCIPCHMPTGQGNPAMKSPPIAGQEGWYLETSLKKFMKGIRGGDPAKDPQANMMSMMTKQFIKTDQDVKDVVAYIRTLKPVPPQHTLKGNADAGKVLYPTCIACHGDKGQGNVALKAPKLTLLPDWYIVEQLKKFKSGIRGAHPDDTEGKLMAPMSQILATEQMMKDVAEYIKTFSAP